MRTCAINNEINKERTIGIFPKVNGYDKKRSKRGGFRSYL